MSRWISALRPFSFSLEMSRLGALPVGAGEHRVLRRDPALPLGDVAAAARSSTLAVHEHMGVAASDQAGALGKLVYVGNDHNWAQLIVGPSI